MTSKIFEDSKKTSISMDRELWARVKTYAASRRITITELLEDELRGLIEEPLGQDPVTMPHELRAYGADLEHLWHNRDADGYRRLAGIVFGVLREIRRDRKSR